MMTFSFSVLRKHQSYKTQKVRDVSFVSFQNTSHPTKKHQKLVTQFVTRKVLQRTKITAKSTNTTILKCPKTQEIP